MKKIRLIRLKRTLPDAWRESKPEYEEFHVSVSVNHAFEGLIVLFVPSMRPDERG